MIEFVKKFCLSIITLVVILYLSFMNTEQLPPQPVVNFDKLLHSLMFFGLSSVFFFDLTSRFRVLESKKKIFYYVLLFPIIIGGFIEIIQENFTETRSGDWFDFLFNVLGSSFAYAISLIISSFALIGRK